jgi:hypothetical protein
MFTYSNIKYSVICVSIVICFLLFSSCALIVNNKYQQVKVVTTPDLKVEKVFKLDSTRVFNEDGPGKYYVKRSNFPLLVQFRANDSSLINYYLESKLSPAFVYGNLVYGFPVGHLIDMNFKTKFRHQPYNYFSYNAQKKEIEYSSLRPNLKNDLKILLGWSWLNAYHNSMFKYYSGDVTPLGANVQLEYFLKENQSLLFETGVSSTIVPKSPRYYSHKDSVVQNFSNNLWCIFNYRYYHKRMSLAAGISFAPAQTTRASFNVSHRDTVYPGEQDTTAYAILSQPRYYDQDLFKTGLNFNLEYRLNNVTNAGVNWQLYLTDANRRNGIYSSHFFNFYITVRLCQFNRRIKY